MRKLLRRLRALILRERLDRELDQELRFHVEMDAESLTRAGLGAEEAHRQAERALGGVLRVREAAHDARGVRPVEELLHDLRFGARALVRKPSFTIATLLTFALGVGGTATVLGAVNAILLAPFSYPESDRLVFVWERDLRRDPTRNIEPSPANFLDWRERNQSFRHLAAMEPFGLAYLAPEGPVYLSTWLVTEGFFDVMGLRPVRGRAFRQEDHQRGAAPVVMLGHGMWRRQFGGDPRIVGQVVTIDGKPTEIVGVLPKEFELMSDVAWAPKVWEGWEAQARTARFYTVIGRLRDGVTPAVAQADMDRVASQLAAEHAGNAGFGAALVPLAEEMVGGARRALLVLLGAVGLVLLVTSANVASLQLARGLDRLRELSVRAALGAGRGRLARQLVTETALLALVGTALGGLLAFGGVALLGALAPPDLPRVERLRVDGTVFLFAAGLGLVTAMVAGVASGWSTSRGAQAGALSGGSRTQTAGRGVRRLRAGLVTIQFAVALVLLVGVGLLLRSFVALMGEDRGFRSEHVLVMAAQAWSYFPTPAARAEFVRQASDLLAAIPGVESVGMTSAIPLGEPITGEAGRFSVVGIPVDSSQVPEVHVTVATAGFFRALDIPLRGGRLFSPADVASSAPVVLINETLARQYFGDENPVGRRVMLTFQQFSRFPVEREVIGIVGDVRRLALNQAARPAMYVPHAQMPVGATGWVLRTARDPETVTDAAKRAIWSLNGSMPISLVTTMERLVGATLSTHRFLLALLAGFASVALVLAATGIFGVISYSTGERTREIGVRMAFGADRGRVLAMVLKDGGRLAIIGIAIGLGGAVAATRVLSGMLHGVTPLDPATFGAGIALLAAVALAATLLPARRAAGLDPVDALRSE